MFQRKIIAAVLFLIIAQTAFSQTTDKDKPKMTDEELRKQAVELLRETSGEVGTLRSLENRISFSSELAGLMWFYDEKQAAVMYQTVITDFKQLLTDYDSQMNALGITPNETDYQAGIFGGGDGGDKARITQKFFKAIGVRQQVAMNLAEHDGTLAYNFYYDTLSLITNPELRKNLEQRDSYFEARLIQQIALTDPAKAVEFGRKSLAKGVNWSHIDLLRKIYDKDNEKGADFADEIVKKIKSDKIEPDSIYNVISFMKMGDENLAKLKKESGKKPMFSEQNMRDMAEVLGRTVMENTATNPIPFDSYSELLDKYAPSRAAQIRTKIAVKVKTNEAPITRAIPDAVVLTAEMEKQKSQNETTQNNKRKEQQEMMQDLQKLGKKELPKEEREKIIAQSRKIIGGMDNKSEKIMALSMLATQVSTLGDKELAADVLKDAQLLINPSPKNYRDFMETWFLASAYAQNDADKAFPVLEDAIFRLNETLAAFIKVGEFMDVSGEMIEDGEVQLGAFGGEMVSGLTRELGVANSTIRNLAVADFAKTKALTNKFDRTEVRILAKMLVLRAVLGNKNDKKEAELEKTTEEF